MPNYGMLQDLNDFVYFAAVVRHGGFSAAGRVLNVPKSKLSRHIAALEERLGVRLLERTVKRFRVTEIGNSFYSHCENMLREAERAARTISDASGEPHGPIRVSVPNGLLQGSLGTMFPEFLNRYPKVQLQILATDRRVDIINERLDLAVRAQFAEETDSELTMRVLSKVDLILVASAELAGSLPPAGGIDSLADAPTVSFLSPSVDWQDSDIWEFTGPDGTPYRHEHKPRLSCKSVPALLEAIYAGVGVGLLPDHVCAEGIKEGRLVRLLPEYQMSQATIYLVFTASQGLPTAVRALVDFLVEQFRSLRATTQCRQ
ncbi:LysR substrate-binding domain-containing protein [Rhizobium sp. S152]|uniref:LysR substrate-binding domain-containing protein n=1 Tax=Rhizobium sp. S152 TaxID=3055038 RepID=UPI0025A97270|nr:LysR substrate-binding domain-containing protein [Rhizobium sp. S152]MDM9628753.1 LysR substrate-binding domain-containing protein [Rhizobium sp. S152]